MHKIVLGSEFTRQRAAKIVMQAPAGYVCEVKAPRRTVEQSDKMWAMLSDISIEMAKRGQRYTPEEWKERIMHACGWECQFLPGILDGRPFPTGFRSSKMSKAQMSAMIDWMTAWAAEQGIPLPDAANDTALSAGVGR